MQITELLTNQCNGNYSFIQLTSGPFKPGCPGIPLTPGPPYVQVFVRQNKHMLTMIVGTTYSNSLFSNVTRSTSWSFDALGTTA